MCDEVAACTAEPYTALMSAFRSQQLRQLGGVGVLGAYLLAQAWWLTSFSPDDTSDSAFVALLVGAPIAFAVGWYGVPFVIRKVTRPSPRRRHQHRAHRHDGDSGRR